MNTLESTLLNVAESVAPDSPALDVAEAVIATVAAPTPEAILADITLAMKLIKKLKALAGTHPHISDILKAIF